MLDAAFSALADPTRRAIIARLAQGEATVLELAKPFAISQPAVSRHIRILADAGLITQRVAGARRPCRLAPDAFGEIDRWLATMRAALAQNYDRLDAVLDAMATPETDKED
jgi:DNA-binding transcriptional ArsR family regulator